MLKLSGISRRVQRRTSWMAEQVVCSFGLELWRGKQRGKERVSRKS